MIQDQKITVGDGARLLAALSERDRQTRSMVSVNLPPSRTDAGLNITSSFSPDIAIDAAYDENGEHVEIDGEESREHLKVFVV
jgi:hypothetical protein